MNKFSVLVIFFCLAAGGHAIAQTRPLRKESDKHKQETPEVKKQTDKEKAETAEADDKQAGVIKAVPAATDKHVKPAKVNSAKPHSARPGSRGARSARPPARPIRPGNRRN